MQVIRQGTQRSEGMAGYQLVLLLGLARKKECSILKIGAQSIRILLVAIIAIITTSAYGRLTALPRSIQEEIEAQEW